MLAFERTFMEKKESRRVKMTKQLLAESFLNLLSEKTIYKITVKEICENADLNRSTYYAYYSDPYDQLNSIETDIMMGMMEYVDSITVGEKETSIHQFQTIRAVLEYINSKKSLFRILLGEYGDTGFERKMLSFFGNHIFSKDFFDDKTIVKKSYQYIYAATGSFWTMIHWLLKDDETDIDTMAGWISELIYPLLKL